MEIFKIQVNLAADVQATFFLTYQELLKRDLGKYIQRFVIEPGQIIANLTVTAVYNENQGFESFTYQLPGSLETRVGSSSDSVKVKAAVGSRELVYMPTVSDQTTMSAKGLNGELVISYELTHKKDGGVVIVDNEYFVHYVSPTGLEIMDKTILFVIDISGSMGGQKIRQARESMIIILDKLNSNDYFNILLFDGDITRWLDVPVLANIENIGKAKAYVNEYVKASGATNINDALLSAIDSLRGRSEESSRSQVIVLLTDGQPSAGETNTKQIRKNVYRRNEGLAAIFCLGFGFNLDWPFLKHLAYENGGFARRIYEDKDAPVQLEHFYLEIKNPVMKNVVISYGSGVESTTKRDFYQYFEGSEIVVSGKTKIPNAFPNQQLSVVGIANTGNNLNLKVESNSVFVWNKDDSKFTEKLWAYKKIKELLLMAEVYDNATAKSLALNMSLEYNFVTPVTSFVLVQSDEFRLDETHLQSGRSNVYYKSGVGSASFLKPSILVIFTLLVLLNYSQL